MKTTSCLFQEEISTPVMIQITHQIKDVPSGGGSSDCTDDAANPPAESAQGGAVITTQGSWSRLDL